MKPRAALHQSAPSAMARAMSKPLAILPEAPRRMRSRAPMPTSAIVHEAQAVAQGHAEMVHELQEGAAPVPPSFAVHDDEIGIDLRFGFPGPKGEAASRNGWWLSDRFWNRNNPLGDYSWYRSKQTRNRPGSTRPGTRR